MGPSAPSWQRLAPFQKLAETLLRHLEGILNYCRVKVPFGVVEAVNKAGNVHYTEEDITILETLAGLARSPGTGPRGCPNRRSARALVLARVAQRRRGNVAAADR